jgi:zinc transporter ZupT
MELLGNAVVYASIFFVVAAVFAFIPFRLREAQSARSWSLVLSAGLMMGVLFFMMIPEALEHGLDSRYSVETCIDCIMAGFLMVLLLGYVLFVLEKNARENSIKSLWIGFCVDVFIDGIVVAAGLLAGGNTGLVVLLAMCMNKATEVFALSTQIVSGASHDSAKKMMLIYIILNPIAVMIGYFGLSGGPGDITSPALCFASGIFMYAALSEMVPQTFEGDGRFNFKTIFIFAVGIAMAYLLDMVTGGI